MAGNAVLLIPFRGECPDESVLPGHYRQLPSIMRVSAGQVQAVGEELGLEVEVRGNLEPLRAKLVKLADRYWLGKRSDRKFTARL